jgi:hypothetical protein
MLRCNMFFPRGLRALSVVALVNSCGGGDLAAPEPTFPDVAGIYSVTGVFDDLPPSDASFNGTLTLTQGSRESGVLGGTMAVTTLIGGDVSGGTLPLHQATVTPNDEVTFVLNGTENATWTFTGTRSGTTIIGRHTLSDGTRRFSGAWRAVIGGNAPAPGSLSVEVTTSGASPDSDGYIIALNGTNQSSIGTNANLTFSELAPGSFLVGLVGVAPNCRVEGENPRIVTVSAGARTTVRFAVVCSTPTGGTGTIRVVTTTTGVQPDPDGYTVTLNGTNRVLSLPATGSATFTAVAVGNHGVTLSGAAANCNVLDGPSRSVAVTQDATAQASFAIACVAPGASQLTEVSGNGQSGTVGSTLANPLVVEVTDASGAPVAGVAVNWTVSGGASVSPENTTTNAEGRASTQLTLGGNVGVYTATAVVAGLGSITFNATAAPGTPSPANSEVSAAPATITAGSGQSTVTVAIRDGNNNPVSGATVTLSVSGTGNTITPATASTTASGLTTFTFSSTVAEVKTITAIAEGVIIADQAAVTVQKASSTIEITDEGEDPSTVGQEIEIEFVVTGTNGNTPTGEVVVTLTNGPETCNATLSEGRGSCRLTPATAGPDGNNNRRDITATYGGNTQFSSDSDTENHRVIAAPPATSLRAAF